jgi:hypothetical protein
MAEPAKVILPANWRHRHVPLMLPVAVRVLIKKPRVYAPAPIGG